MNKALTFHLIQLFKFEEGCVIGDFLVTSLSIFLLISMPVNPQKASPFPQIKSKVERVS